MVGASMLSAEAALRTGVGSVKVLCSNKTFPIFALKFASLLKKEINTFEDFKKFVNKNKVLNIQRGIKNQKTAPFVANPIRSAQEEKRCFRKKGGSAGIVSVAEPSAWSRAASCGCCGVPGECACGSLPTLPLTLPGLSAALHAAGRAADPAATQRAIDSGANVNTADGAGRTPLNNAADAAVVSVLVAAGARFTAGDRARARALSSRTMPT